MIDMSNDGLLNNNDKRNMISFDSISEKQEESSNSSPKNSKLGKSKTTIKNKNSILKSNIDVSRDGINVSNISIKRARKKKRPTEKSPQLSFLKRKSILKEVNKEDDKDLKSRLFRRRETKKKTNRVLIKRTSFQHDNHFSFLKKALDDTRKSTNNMGSQMNLMGRTTLKDKKSINLNLSTNKITSISSLYNNRSINKNRSINISNSDSFLDMKYFGSKRLKHTMLRTGKLNFHDHKSNMNSTNLFEKLKDSYLYERSEALLFKIKICYGFLAVFSFISILLEIIDVIIFNSKSSEYLLKNFHINVINDTNIDNYYFIQNRKITGKENAIRVFNLIFSVICLLIHLIIHYIKNNYDKQSRNKNRYNNNYYGYRRKSKRTRTLKDSNNGINNENKIKFILNDNFISKDYVSREEIIRLGINCLISLIFYPPGLNKVFIGIQDNYIYVYSLNSIFLLATFLKLTNIYFAIYYLSPFNNLLYKTICNSNMVKLDFKFMFRFMLNLYPFAFAMFNFIIISLMVCILIYCMEYFTINIKSGLWNNKGENDLKNFYNVIFLFIYFALKSIHGNLKAETIIGSLILLIGGTIGLFISSYIILYINQLFDLRQEEQQAYTKLVKLLNPLNNEHKASNVIKIFLLLKKMYIDNQNIEREYLIKKEKNFKLMVQKNFGLRKSNFNFGLNDSHNSLLSYVENNEYKEKKKLLSFIGNKFVLKTKIANECKNFKNILLIARNYAQPFNDVLKTLGDKMNGNINQLNNKLEVLIQNDIKFRNFMKFQNNSVKKIEKVNDFQKYVLNYLIELNNEISLGYISGNKEMQNNFLIKFKKLSSKYLRRLKSSGNGPMFNFGKKTANRKTSENEEKKSSKQRKESKDFFDKKEIIKIGAKRLRSSVMRKKSFFHPKIDVTRSNTNPLKNINNKSKIKAKSFDDTKLNIFQKRNVNNKLEGTFINKFNRKIHSSSAKKKIIIDKWKNKFEK